MNYYEKKLVDLGIIDSPLEDFEVKDWFDEFIISFLNLESNGLVICKFKDCFSINFKHEKDYEKSKDKSGKNTYKYYIQNIRVEKDGEFFYVKIEGWPFEGEVFCKNIIIQHEK